MTPAELAYWLWERVAPNYQGDKAPSDVAWKSGVTAGLVRRDGEGFAVADAETLNALSADHVREARLRALVTDPEALFATAAAIGRLDFRASNIEGRALAALHNEGAINLLRAAAAIAPSTRSFFPVLQVLEGAVQSIEGIDTDDLLALEKAYHDRVKGDLAGGRLRVKLRARFATKPLEARAIIDRQLANPDLRTAPLFVDALAGLSATDLPGALEIALAATSRAPEVRRPALFALGHFAYDGSQAPLGRAVACLRGILDANGDPASEDAVEPLAQLATHGLIDASIFVQLARHGPKGLYEAANWAAFHSHDLPTKPWLDDLLAAFAHAEPDMAGVLGVVDHALQRLIAKDGMQDRVIATLEAWLVRQEAKAGATLDFGKQFESVVAEVANRPQLVNRMLTRWLVADDGMRPLAARQLVQWLEVHRASSQLEFDLDQVANDSADDLVLLLRRTLGYVFQRDPLISLILSLADLPGAESWAFGFIADAFMWGPGYDYPEAALEALRSRREALAPEVPKAQFFDELIEAIDAHEKTLAALPERAELVPSYHKRRAVVRRHQRMNELIHRDAEKQSIFSQLAMKIPLKAGRKTFGKEMGDFGNVMKLAQMSTEFPWPRSESTDPVGRAIHRRLYMRATKPRST